jgi:nuclear pore complex protein Nup205
MEKISRLRTILLHNLTGGEYQYGDQEIFDALMANKSRLLRLLDVGPRNAQEQRELESGK